MTFTPRGKLLAFDFDVTAEDDNPLSRLIDDVGLANRLAISRKTLWWLITTNTFKNQSAPPRGMYIHHRIPKGRGKFRDIHEPKEVLKNVQKALLVTFFKQDTAPDHVSAYVTGRKITHGASQHVGAAVKISLDIKNFFPSITRRMVLEHLTSEMGFHANVANWITTLVTVPVARKDDPDRGIFVLPQGAPTSAALSNRIAMVTLDRPILESLPEDATYTRYCDNLEVSFATARSREEIDAYVREILQTIHAAGWRANPRKTKIQRATSPTRPMRVLGIGVQTKLGAPPQEYRRLRTVVHLVTTHGVDERFQTSKYGARYPDDFEGLYLKLRGELQYWHQVDPGKFKPLLDALTTYRQELKCTT